METESQAIKNLENRWCSLFQMVENQKLVKQGFDNLVSKYSEEHRYYHTLCHVENCLNQIDLLADYISDKFCIEVAIWFHDVIYSPEQGDNEELSADYAQEFLESIELEQDQIHKIIDLILLTKHPSKPITSDEKYLIDIDLSILGADEDKYNIYESWIRKEYVHVPDDEFKLGRKKVLSSFIESDYLYCSDYFRERYEAQARQNIVCALHSLLSQ